MSRINDGGPAFPLQSIGPDFAPGYAGMSLRDYFAAKAMQALVASETEGFRPDSYSQAHQYAKRAFDMADAMLAERAKEQP